MTIFQSSYSQRPDEAVIGMRSSAFDPAKIEAKTARGVIKAGYGVFRFSNANGSSPYSNGTVYHVPTPGPTAQVSAIATSFASSASPQVVNLNGVVGASEMQPGRTITLVLSSHANWTAGNATLVGVLTTGQPATETLAIPSGGNATVTSVNTYRSVVSLSMPAGGGTSGTATVGVSALATLTIDDFVGVALRQPAKNTQATNSMFNLPGLTSNAITCDYIDAEEVPVLSEGGIWVFTEKAISDRAKIYVRITSGSGGSVLGAFRDDSDSSTCVLVTGARCKRNAVSGLAWISLAPGF